MVLIKFGLEIEAEYNNTLYPLQVTGYHNSNVGDNFDSWSVTSDSSLTNTQQWGEDSRVAELVSTPLFGWEEVYSALLEVKAKANGKELNECLLFNTSTGAHIHFSTWRGREGDMMFMQHYNQLRNNVMARVKEEYPRIYPLFKKQYIRDYSRTQHEMIINKHDRRMEINYESVAQGKGVEWRSFNLVGVETWDELFGMYKIAVDELTKIMAEYEASNYREFIELIASPEDIAVATRELSQLLEPLVEE